MFFGDKVGDGTFSVLAKSGRVLGAASASGSIAVGSRVIHAKPGVGVVVTQGYTNVSYGPKGLELMEEGLPPAEALKRLLRGDRGQELRQAVLMSAKGEIAVHTGRLVPDCRGQVVGKNYVVVGNLLKTRKVLNAMAAAFEGHRGSLTERMIRSLEAGRDAGGDRRGERSAALVVIDLERVKIRLDVNDHPSPIEELRELFWSLDLPPRGGAALAFRHPSRNRNGLKRAWPF